MTTFIALHRDGEATREALSRIPDQDAVLELVAPLSLVAALLRESASLRPLFPDGRLTLRAYKAVVCFPGNESSLLRERQERITQGWKVE
jgi:hypothetical protein